MSKSGYYESHLTRKTLLTNEKIKEFEEDVKAGKEIDLESYYVPEKKDYSSFASKLGKKVTLHLSTGLEKIFNSSGKVLKKLFW